MDLWRLESAAGAGSSAGGRGGTASMIADPESIPIGRPPVTLLHKKGVAVTPCHGYC